MKTLNLVIMASTLTLAGCSAFPILPTSGPSRENMTNDTQVRVVQLTRSVAQQVSLFKGDRPPSDLPQPQAYSEQIATGDFVEIGIWEAAPAMLLGGVDASSTASGRGLMIPSQVVSLDGTIGVPFVGRVAALGKTPAQLEREIVKALEGKANRPQALVRLGSAIGQEVTVVGGVRTNLRFGLTARKERLLDALALSGGSTFPLEKTTVQVARGQALATAPLDAIVKDPRQNIPLGPADIVTVYHQPKSFVALGAVSKVGDIPFEATGIDLAQALARVGGPIDNRADVNGVFVARLNGTAPPAVYQLDLRQPGSLFVMKDFKVQDQDVIYVANASAAELQKFLSLLGAAVYPIDAAARNLGSN
ncbi:MAG: polysaccharide biosynthesis/export family protein [Burkholderiales bacterium]|jgi:polysaccharide export outer membrane protein